MFYVAAYSYIMCSNTGCETVYIIGRISTNWQFLNHLYFFFTFFIYLFFLFILFFYFYLFILVFIYFIYLFIYLFFDYFDVDIKELSGHCKQR